MKKAVGRSVWSCRWHRRMETLVGKLDASTGHAAAAAAAAADTGVAWILSTRYAH